MMRFFSQHQRLISTTSTGAADRTNGNAGRRLLLTSVLGIALAVLLGGCGVDFKLSGIQVNAIEVKQVSSTTLETQVTLVLRYTNENVVPIAAANTIHKLYLNGKYVGKAVSDKPVGMPPTGTVTQETTFMLENIALLNQLKQIAEKQTASYKLESRIRVQSGEEENEYRTSSEGAIDLRPLLNR